jgi:hypothetical protein
LGIATHSEIGVFHGIGEEADVVLEKTWMSSIWYLYGETVDAHAESEAADFLAS